MVAVLRCWSSCRNRGDRIADVNRLFPGHTVVESDGTVPAGRSWTSGSRF